MINASRDNPISTDSIDSRPVMLIVDDDPSFCAQIAFFSSDKFQVFESHATSKVDLDTLLKVDILVLDLNIPDQDGIDFIRTLATLKPHPKLLIASGYEDHILDMAKLTAQSYGMHNTASLRKPIDRKTFIETIDILCGGTNTEQTTVSSHAGLHHNLTDIRQGIRKGEFIPYYQPQIDMANYRFIGIEALARWDHPKHGILTPGDFIDTIELSEVATEFTMRMIEAAMLDYGKLVAATGYQGRLSINVPPDEFGARDFADRVLDAAYRLNFPAEKLVCEITERGIEDISPAIKATFTRLKMHCIQLSVDDFGTGQSGLSKLKEGMFDELKIDRIFIKNLISCQNSKLIVGNVLNLAEKFGLRIVVEGVEGDRTLSQLMQLGLPIVQGYYFSKPIPVDQLILFTRKWPLAAIKQ